MRICAGRIEVLETQHATQENQVKPWSYDVTAKLSELGQTQAATTGPTGGIQQAIVDDIVRRLVALERRSVLSGASLKPVSAGLKPLLESEAVSNLATLDGTRGKYQERPSKFRNAASVWCRGSHDVIRWAEHRYGPIKVSDFDQQSFSMDFCEASEQLGSLWGNTTTGQAISKLFSGIQRDGVEAHRRFHACTRASPASGSQKSTIESWSCPYPKRTQM